MSMWRLLEPSILVCSFCTTGATTSCSKTRKSTRSVVSSRKSGVCVAAHRCVSSKKLSPPFARTANMPSVCLSAQWKW